MNISIRTAKGIYCGVWLTGATWAALSELNYLPCGFIKSTAENEYVLHLLCVTLTMTCTWLALKLFAMKRIRKKIDDNIASLGTWNVCRTGILAMAIFMNLFAYYGLTSSTTPLFCLLITLAGFVFCWPKTDE